LHEASGLDDSAVAISKWDASNAGTRIRRDLTAQAAMYVPPGCKNFMAACLLNL